MTWFKVDDGLHKHRKRIRAGISIEGFAAIGLWSIAGSWSSDELSDGWIADEVLDYVAPGFGEQLAARLEYAGFWHREERDGEKGWQFHDWGDHQPMAEKVLAERAESAERQRKARERAKVARDGGKDSSGQASPSSGESQGESQRDGARTHQKVSGAVTVPPTRPDPTRTSSGSTKSGDAATAATTHEQSEADEQTVNEQAKSKTRAERATRLPRSFEIDMEMRIWAEARVPGLDIDAHTEKFTLYWWSKSGKDATKVDWVMTWKKWMLDEFGKLQNSRARASPPRSTPGTGSNYRNQPDDMYTEEIPE